MSLVMSIIFVLGLFTLIGLVAWAAVALDMHRSREVLSPPSTVDASLDESRELVGQLAG